MHYEGRVTAITSTMQSAVSVEGHRPAQPPDKPTIIESSTKEEVYAKLNDIISTFLFNCFYEFV